MIETNNAATKPISDVVVTTSLSRRQETIHSLIYRQQLQIKCLIDEILENTITPTFFRLKIGKSVIQLTILPIFQAQRNLNT